MIALAVEYWRVALGVAVAAFVLWEGSKRYQ